MLSSWSKPILLAYSQEQTMKQLKNQKKGWFGGFSQDDTAEAEKIDKFFKELTDEGISTQVTKRPPEFVCFSLEFQLKAGKILVA
jgi:hypothetical protein